MFSKMFISMHKVKQQILQKIIIQQRINIKKNRRDANDFQKLFQNPSEFNEKEKSLPSKSMLILIERKITMQTSSSPRHIFFFYIDIILKTMTLLPDNVYYWQNYPGFLQWQCG